MKQDILKLNLQDLIVLFSILLFQFFSIFSFVLVKINANSNQVFNPRISPQSRYGFGSDPGPTLVILLIFSFLLYLSFFIILNLIKTHFGSLDLQNFIKLVYPTFLLSLIIFVRVLINKLSLQVPEVDGILTIFNYLLSGNNWTIIFILNISILFTQIIVLSLKSTSTLNVHKVEQFIKILGWLVPISIFQIFNISKFYLSNDPFMFSFFALLLLSLFILIMNVPNLQIKRFVLFLIAFLTLSAICITRIPLVLYSWRPEWTFIKIDSTIFLIFTLIFTLLLTIPILSKYVSLNFLYISIASIYYTFAIPHEVSLAPDEDSLHYGEKIGLWFNQEFGQLSPYSELELPRGLLVNYFPAKIANFLSPGNPETFKYSLIIYALILGPLIFLALKQFLGITKSISILLLTPFPNAFVEIEFFFFCLLLIFVYLLNRFKLDILFISFSFLSFPILIMLAPGQGLVFIILFLVVLFFNRRRFYIEKNGVKQTLSFLIFLTFILVSTINFSSIKSALIWVIRTGSANSSMYGDNWIARLYQTDLFPSNIRWSVLFIIPFLMLINILYFKKLNRLQTLLIILIYVYCILMSGRWFARVEIDIPSRIGVGVINLTLFLIFPLIGTLSKRIINYVFSLFYLVLLFFTIPAINFSPLVPAPNFRDISIPSSQILNSPLERNRGNQYRDVSFLVRSVFGENPGAANISGGTASDFYMKIPSKGGVQSTFLIVNDAQELEWLSRLEKTNVQLLYGGYSQLGGIAADQTSLATRARLFSKWSITNFIPFSCKDVYFALKLTSLDIYKDELTKLGCRFAETSKDKLKFWEAIDYSLKNYDNSFYMWSKNLVSYNPKLFDPQVIQLSGNNSSYWNKVQVDCKGAIGAYEIELYKISGDGVLRTNFSTTLRDGVISWDSRIFPIFNLGPEKTFMNLRNSPCVVI